MIDDLEKRRWRTVTHFEVQWICEFAEAFRVFTNPRDYTFLKSIRDGLSIPKAATKIGLSSGRGYQLFHQLVRKSRSEERFVRRSVEHGGHTLFTTL